MFQKISFICCVWVAVPKYIESPNISGHVCCILIWYSHFCNWFRTNLSRVSRGAAGVCGFTEAIHLVQFLFGRIRVISPYKPSYGSWTCELITGKDCSNLKTTMECVRGPCRIPKGLDLNILPRKLHSAHWPLSQNGIYKISLTSHEGTHLRRSSAFLGRYRPKFGSPQISWRMVHFKRMSQLSSCL